MNGSKRACACIYAALKEVMEHAQTRTTQAQCASQDSQQRAYRIHIFIDIHTYIHTYIHTCVCMLHVYVCCMYVVCMSIYIYIYIYICVCVCVCVYTYIRKCSLRCLLVKRGSRLCGAARLTKKKQTLKADLTPGGLPKFTCVY
jgi:hypothetical protein